MSYPLDINLRRVAKLRQVTIKTARDWRDSENLKWFTALEELVKLRNERGRDIINLEPIGFFESLACLEVDSERMDTQEAQAIKESLSDLSSRPLSWVSKIAVYCVSSIAKIDLTLLKLTRPKKPRLGTCYLWRKHTEASYSDSPPFTHEGVNRLNLMKEA
jgi:hypothetical protein